MSRSSWFVERRVEWIAESVRIFGSINRAHVVLKFGVSVPQASADIAETMHRHAGLMQYDASAKAYRRCPGAST